MKKDFTTKKLKNNFPTFKKNFFINDAVQELYL